MKNQKILLDIEEEEEEITLGLVRLSKDVADYELFFQINTLNTFKFSRIADYVHQGKYYEYHFPRFQAFHTDSRICIHFISNKSAQNILKKVSTELFSVEEQTLYLLDGFQDVDYLIWTSEPFDDFSVILLPENMVFQIQNFPLSSNEELFHSIQYYA
ncbi:IPExxxVDY family protein [Chryseobacterium sp. MP_3.2]|uniref:IPExxxVDY family protein n=1 Tax=Chryseobacterium sp. MP_3.2 TaxID=3071712 RepID=UPI002E0939ED|nr:hypothetical protein [Chryseobacterium sp. MP_3.2]